MRLSSGSQAQTSVQYSIHGTLDCVLLIDSWQLAEIWKFFAGCVLQIECASHCELENMETCESVTIYGLMNVFQFWEIDRDIELEILH